MLNLSPATLITRIITLVIAFSVHEFAHAWSATQLGDDTPRLNGRLTLNPLAHLDVMGSLMLLVAGFGWAKPVPVNAYALMRRSPAGLMLVSLAGPLANLLMAILAAVPLRLNLFPASYSSGLLPTPYSFLLEFMVINLLLMLFNLIPLAPLDGEKVATYFLPARWARSWDSIRPYSPLILMALIFVLPMVGVDVIGWIMRPAMNSLITLLIGA
ncbi:MAG: site-2 protease family protein [Anaerolineae bacterium]|jgi:Zn-dependent protease|nr:site-2 protease family protein [Anaerolineae bacterium]